MATDEDFKKWLEDDKNMSPRSCGDVVSRLRRVSLLVDPLKPQSAPELSYLLSQNPAFNSYSNSVRSQLKRAALLYKEFTNIKEAT